MTGLHGKMGHHKDGVCPGTELDMSLRPYFIERAGKFSILHTSQS
jgi:hypothetical protein